MDGKQNGEGMDGKEGLVIGEEGQKGKEWSSSQNFSAYLRLTTICSLVFIHILICITISRFVKLLDTL